MIRGLVKPIVKSQREIDIEKERKLKKDYPKGKSIYDMCPSSYFNKKNDFNSKSCLGALCDFWDYELSRCWLIPLKRG